MTRSFLKPREYIMIIAIALTMIITGSFVDLQFSKAVYDATNTNMFGIIMSGLAEVPGYMCTALAGLLLIITAKEIKLWQKIISWVAGLGAIGFGLYYSFDTFQNIASFKRTSYAKTAILISGIVFVAILAALVAFLVFKKCMKKDRTHVRNIAIWILAIMFVQLFVVTGGKYIISRPRPRYIIGGIGVEEQFRNWWEFQPFKCIELSKRMSENLGYAVSSSNWKSCPSGHSATSIVMAFFLPLLTLLFDDWKNNYKARVIAFYIGAVWGIASAISRIYAGAHFLSDVGAGMLVGSLAGLLAQLILPYFVKDYVA